MPTEHSAAAQLAPPPADTPGELADLLSHAARHLRRGSTHRLAPLGLTHAQARLLCIVAEAGQPLRMADIATRLGVVPRSVTTLVDGVEAAGLLVRAVDPEDRRSVLVRLTTGGRRLLEAVEGARRDSAEGVFGVLSPAERAELGGLLRRLCREARA